jgi:small subunit ribosomal protein S20
MPISASAKKSLRVSQRRAGENRIMKVRVKRQIKQTTTETLGDLFKLLDKAAKNHIMHKNKAARLKSRAAKQLATTPTETAPAKKAAPKAAKKTTAKKSAKTKK